MRSARIRYLLSLLLFGSNGIAAGFIGLDSVEIVCLRSVLGAALLLAICFFAGRRSKKHPAVGKRACLFLALSGLAMGLDWLLLFGAYQQIGVHLSILINYCGPILVVVLSSILFGTRLTKTKMLALAAAMGGLILICGQAVSGGVSGTGILLASVSAGAYAAMILFAKGAGIEMDLRAAAIQLTCAAFLALFFWGGTHGWHMEVMRDDWLPILWISLLNTGLGCAWYFSAVGSLPTQTTAVLGYIEPISAVIFAGVFLGETLGGLQIPGAVLVIGGALLSEISFPVLRKTQPGPAAARPE